MKVYDNFDEAAKDLKTIYIHSDLFAYCQFYRKVGIVCKIIDDNNRLEIILSNGEPIRYKDETLDKRLKGKKIKVIFEYSGKYIEQYA